MRQYSLGLAIVASTWLLACSTPKSDFARLCKISDEVTSDPSIERPDKPTEIAVRFGKTSMSGKTRACMEAVGLATRNGVRIGTALENPYGPLEHCARTAGADGWSCPSLKAHYATPGKSRVVE